MRTITYARVYNSLYAHSISHRRETTSAWLNRKLCIGKGRRRLTTSLRWCVHLHKVVMTQKLGEVVPVSALHRHGRLLRLAWIVSYLRPLQRRILEYLWRPHGRMVARSDRSLREIGLLE